MAKALPNLGGRSLFVHFQRDLDGTQTAARLVRETLARFGVSWTGTASQSEGIIWIQGGSSEMRFAFVVAHPKNRHRFITIGSTKPEEALFFPQ